MRKSLITALLPERLINKIHMAEMFPMIRATKYTSQEMFSGAFFIFSHKLFKLRRNKITPYVGKISADKFIFVLNDLKERNKLMEMMRIHKEISKGSDPEKLITELVE